MTPQLVKFIIELIVLIALWSIARRQEELGSKIEVLEKKDGEFFVLPPAALFGPFMSGSKEPTFKQKKSAEEKRVKLQVGKTIVKDLGINIIPKVKEVK